MLYVKLELLCDLRPLHKRWLFSDLLGRQYLANILQKHNIIAIADDCVLAHWIHRWGNPEIWCSYLRGVCPSFFHQRHMFVPVICSCLEAETSMRTMLQWFPASAPWAASPKNCFYSKMQKAHVVPHCTKTDFSWMVVSQLTPLLLFWAWFPTYPYAPFVSGEILVLQWHCSSLLQPTIFPNAFEALRPFPQGSVVAQTW